MENAADALKIAFAVFVFVIALSITFFLLTEIKDTADTILWYSDKTNYMDKIEGSDTRIVGVDTVISTLKNRGTQDSYVTIIENGNEHTYKLLGTDQENEEVEGFIKEHISGQKSAYTYKETIREITTDGAYMVADDGTKISVSPGGATRRYIIYEKQ